VSRIVLQATAWDLWSTGEAPLKVDDEEVEVGGTGVESEYDQSHVSVGDGTRGAT
jgi:hypothetical protein